MRRPTPFQVATARARADRDAAERELAEQLAVDFAQRPSVFEPARLAALGPEGLSHLLATASRASATKKPPDPSDPALRQRSSASAGWAHLRRDEPSALVDALSWGLLAGLATYALILITARFF